MHGKATTARLNAAIAGEGRMSTHPPIWNTLIEKLEAIKPSAKSPELSEHAYRQAVNDCIAIVRQHEAMPVNDRLVEALRFYSDGDNYQASEAGTMCCMAVDNGRRAKEALASVPETKPVSSEKCAESVIRQFLADYNASLKMTGSNWPDFYRYLDSRLPDGFKMMFDAPRDGTPVLLWIEHENYKHCMAQHKTDWAAWCVGYWSDHNGGGWVWHGLAGVEKFWTELPRRADGLTAHIESGR
jgi:hypothetical protein